MKYDDLKLIMSCKRCFEEKPSYVSMLEFGRTETGILEDGRTMVVWCMRHNEQVAAFELAKALPMVCGGAHY